MVRRFGALASFNAALGGVSMWVENSSKYPTGTPITPGSVELPGQVNPIGGVLNLTSSFSTLEIFNGVPKDGFEGLFGTEPFGYNAGPRQNGHYDLLFLQPGAALAFGIIAQNPAASPAQDRSADQRRVGLLNRGQSRHRVQQRLPWLHRHAAARRRQDQRRVRGRGAGRPRLR